MTTYATASQTYPLYASFVLLEKNRRMLIDATASVAEALLSNGLPTALLLSSIAFSSYLAVAIFVLPSDTCHGCPRWSWIASLPFQMVLLPLVWFLAFSTQKLSLVEWVVSSWDSAQDADPFNLRRLWLVLFFGYIAKDCCMYKCMTPLYWLHHFVCFAICLTYLYLDPPGIFITGAMLSEIGSSSQSLLYIAENSSFGRLVWWNHALTMTLSNIVAVLLAVLLLLQHEQPVVSRTIASLVTVILMEERQRAAIANLRGWRQNGKTTKKE